MLGQSWTGKDLTLSAIAAAAGVAVFLVTLRWHGFEVYSVCLSLLYALALVLGMIEPRKAWRWGVIPFLTHLVLMMAFMTVRGGGNIWPIALAALFIFVIPAILAAYLGALAR